MKTELFDQIAHRYDTVNWLMSFGLLNRWKRCLLSKLHIEEGMNALDVCAGTGWLTVDARDSVGSRGRVAGLDMSTNMLAVARDKLDQRGFSDVELIKGDAGDMPVGDGEFDRIMIGFALRNVSDIDLVLSECYRVCAHGGMIGIIDLTHPSRWWARWGFYVYRRMLLPMLDYIIVPGGGIRPYRYLGRSVDRFVTAQQLADKLKGSGFTNAGYQYLGLGAVAVHWGEKQL